MPSNGKLKFDDKFSERPVRAQLDYLNKLCASQNDALDKMQKERNDLLAKLKEASVLLENADQAYQTQKEIAKNLINLTNEESQGTNERILELEARVKAQDLTIEALNGNQH